MKFLQSISQIKSFLDRKIAIIHTKSRMRDEFVRIIEEYIRAKPEYRHTLNEIKTHVISAGATEEELDEAIRRLTGIPASSKLFSNPSSKKKKPLIFQSKTLALTISLVLIVFAGLFLLNKPDSDKKASPITTLNTTSKSSNNIQSPIAQVYASIREIDPEKAFLYPKSNVPLVVTNKPKKEVLGFFPYWMMPKAFDINLSVLTSITLFGLEVDGKGDIVTINSNTNEVDEGWAMWKNPQLDKFIRKARNERIKIYLTFKAFDNKNIEDLVASDEAQKSFIANALYLLGSKNLDGINLDFEYVGTPPALAKEGFTRLVTNLNAELKRQFPNAQISIDTYLTAGSVPGLFELGILSKHIDSFVVMGYDVHTPLGAAGPIAPMGGNINIVGLLQGYLEQIPNQKIILAVPYYGYDWPNGANADILPYSQIIVDSKRHNLAWDDVSQTPMYTYTVNNVKREVHFENVRSLSIKYDFVNSKDLKGVGIWALGYDGFNSDLQRLIVDKFAN